MTKTITFNELRRIKDCLPDGSMHRIADELNVTVQTVRNYFGGNNYEYGKNCGLHIEPGPDGGIVVYMIWRCLFFKKRIAWPKKNRSK